METKDHENRRVLVADDQSEIHDDFKDIFKPDFEELATDTLASAFIEEDLGQFDWGFDLVHAMSGEQACEIIKTEKEAGRPIAVAYVDIRMPPGIDGVETVRRIRKIDRDVEIVMMTAYTDKPLSVILYKMELLHKLLYIRKPFTREVVQQITLSLVTKWNIERELEERRRHLAISYQRLEAVLNATGDAVAMYDGKTRLVFANRWYEQLFGVKESELKAMSPDEATRQFKEWFRKPNLPDVEQRFSGGGGGELVEQVASDLVPENRMFWRSKQPVRDDQGEVLGDLVVYRDVSKEIEVDRMKAEMLRLRSELQMTYSFEGMVGVSSGMQRTYGLMKKAIESNIIVLLQGESGTGKELVAKLLHTNGRRKTGPFLAINCAAIPETLIESELFGHEKGAFTSATSLQIGCFERANGGTILLDEIGDMSLQLQSKLLRVLQDGEIQRIGGSTAIAVDLRVIAATNKDLDTAIREGTFREDLFYRLAAFPIMLPPLRERREDVPLLANHFLRKHAERINSSVSGFSAAALRVLLQYDWPGNVRELGNAIERAMLLETTEVLQVNNLPPHILTATVQGAHPTDAGEVLNLEVVERQAVTRALEVSDNNLPKAAQALGINRSTLYRKLKKYDLLASE